MEIGRSLAMIDCPICRDPRCIQDHPGNTHFKRCIVRDKFVYINPTKQRKFLTLPDGITGRFCNSCFFRHSLPVASKMIQVPAAIGCKINLPILRIPWNAKEEFKARLPPQLVTATNDRASCGKNNRQQIPFQMVFNAKCPRESTEQSTQDQALAIPCRCIWTQFEWRATSLSFLGHNRS